MVPTLEETGECVLFEFETSFESMKNEKLEMIFSRLSNKSCLKQSVFRNTGVVFNQLEAAASEITEYLSTKINPIDSHVKVEFKSVSEFEFQVKFSGDMLSFIRHSNTVTLPPDHPVMQTDYVKNDPRNGYFGHIMVYNFMADTIKYHRLNDPGYLIARILVNYENHFFLESVRQVNFKHEHIAENVLTPEVLHEFIESVMLAAIDNDLISPGYKDIQMISYNFKLSNQMVSQGEKIGFQLSGSLDIT